MNKQDFTARDWEVYVDFFLTQLGYERGTELYNIKDQILGWRKERKESASECERLRQALAEREDEVLQLTEALKDNKSELLCLRKESNCYVFTLNDEGSATVYTAHKPPPAPVFTLNDGSATGTAYTKHSPPPVRPFDVLQEAIEDGYVTEPGTYYVAMPDEDSVNIQVFSVVQPKNPLVIQ